MDFLGRYQSPFGYTSGDNGVDSYGVNHSGFSTQDELQYQTLRTNRENELANDMQRQGIAQNNYPQYGTSFWSENLSRGTNYDISKLNLTVQNALNLAKKLPTQNQQGQNSPWNNLKKLGENFADATQAATVGYTTGLTLGNFDEAMGGATALLTWNSENYVKGRDVTRQLQNDLSQRHPYLYGGAEFVGAMTTPLQLFKGAKKMDNVLNAVMNTGVASVGYAENWKDFGNNLIANGVANSVGVKMNQLPLMRGVGAGTRKMLTQGVNYITNKIKDTVKNKDW